MKLSFGNMTLKLNVFNLCKQPSNNEDEDEYEDDDFIETIVEEKIQEDNLNQQNEACLMENFESEIKEVKNDDNAKLELKDLPIELKYSFFGEKKNPVEISSKILPNHEGNLIKKHKKTIEWTQQCENAFNKLINILTTSPILKPPD